MQKYVNLVDLVKSFVTSIYLQKSASIQPRTSLSKFPSTCKRIYMYYMILYVRKTNLHVIGRLSQALAVFEERSGSVKTRERAPIPLHRINWVRRDVGPRRLAHMLKGRASISRRALQESCR